MERTYINDLIMDTCNGGHLFQIWLPRRVKAAIVAMSYGDKPEDYRKKYNETGRNGFIWANDAENAVAKYKYWNLY